MKRTLCVTAQCLTSPMLVKMQRTIMSPSTSFSSALSVYLIWGPAISRGGVIRPSNSPILPPTTPPTTPPASPPTTPPARPSGSEASWGLAGSAGRGCPIAVGFLITPGVRGVGLGPPAGGGGGGGGGRNLTRG